MLVREKIGSARHGTLQDKHNAPLASRAGACPYGRT